MNKHQGIEMYDLVWVSKFMQFNFSKVFLLSLFASFKSNRTQNKSKINLSNVLAL